MRNILIILTLTLIITAIGCSNGGSKLSINDLSSKGTSTIPGSMLIAVPSSLVSDFYTVYDDFVVSDHSMTYMLDNTSTDEKKAFAYLTFGTYTDIYLDRVFLTTCDCTENQNLTTIETLASAYGAQVRLHYYFDGADNYLLVWPTDQTREYLAATCAAMITAKPNVIALCSPDSWATGYSSDPYYDEHVHDSPYGFFYPLLRVSAPIAWETTRGRYATGTKLGQQSLVAVLDTGICEEHTDFWNGAQCSYVNIGDGGYQSNFSGAISFSTSPPYEVSIGAFKDKGCSLCGIPPREESIYEPWENFVVGDNAPPGCPHISPSTCNYWCYNGNGHGTKCSGVISALDHDSSGEIGLIGVAPEAGVVPIRMTQDFGIEEIKLPYVAKELVRAKSQYNINVVSFAYGYHNKSKPQEDMLKILYDNEILFVGTDTGNAIGDGGYPAKYVDVSDMSAYRSGIISVSYQEYDGSFMQTDGDNISRDLDDWDNFDSTSLFAPSDVMCLTEIQDLSILGSGWTTDPLSSGGRSGVSFGIPLVAGVATLGICAGYDFQEIKSVLMNNAKPCYDFGPRQGPSLGGITQSYYYKQIDAAFIGTRHGTQHTDEVDPYQYQAASWAYNPACSVISDNRILQGMISHDANGSWVTPYALVYELNAYTGETLPPVPDFDGNECKVCLPYHWPNDDLTCVVSVDHQIPGTQFLSTSFYERHRSAAGSWTSTALSASFLEPIGNNRDVADYVSSGNGGVILFADVPESMSDVTYAESLLLPYGDMGFDPCTGFTGEPMEICKGSSTMDPMLLMTEDTYGAHRVYEYYPATETFSLIFEETDPDVLVTVGEMGSKSGLAWFDPSTKDYGVCKVETGGMTSWYTPSMDSSVVDDFTYIWEPRELQLTGSPDDCPYLVIIRRETSPNVISLNPFYGMEGIRVNWDQFGYLKSTVTSGCLKESLGIPKPAACDYYDSRPPGFRYPYPYERVIIDSDGRLHIMGYRFFGVPSQILIGGEVGHETFFDDCKTLKYGQDMTGSSI